MLPLGRRERGIAGGGRRRLAGRGPGSVRGGVCGLLAWGLLASLLAVVAPVGVAPAGAQSQSSALVSNLGQASTGHQSLGRDAAQAFTTGGNAGGYTVDSVGVQFVQLSDAAVFGSKVTVTINRDSGGSPGAVVDALTNPAFVATNSERNYTFAAPAGGVWLEADTTYWLVVDSDGTHQGSNRIRFTALDGEDAGGASGWSIGDTSIFRSAGSTGGWTSWNSSLKIEIAGSASTAPTANADGSYTVPFSWPLRPASIGPDGGDFRLLFLTQGTRDATSADIADYDAFVQASASGSHAGGAHSAVRPYASLFKAVASTATVNARVHTGMDWSNPSDLDAPIHWLNGPQVMSGSTLFWITGNKIAWSPSDRRNAAGVAPTGSVLNSRVWTGTDNGQVIPNGGLGASDGTAYSGSASITGETSHFWRHSENPTSDLLPLYGVSPVFRVLPAPALNAAGSVDVPEDWGLTPEGVPPGGEFRLLFLTSDFVDVRSSDISVYDEFVRRSAAGLHSGGAHDAIRPYAARFQALASTSTVDARTHLGMDPNDAADRDVPVFWLDGGRVAANSSGFWSNTWTNSGASGRRNAAGGVAPSGASDPSPATGTNADGSKHASGHFGSGSNVRVGQKGSNSDPVSFGAGSNNLARPLFAVSPVFRRPLKSTAAGSYVVPHDWALKPSGLNPGDEFRLMFVTADTRDATATDIGVYDSFVQTSARGGHTGGAHQAVRSYASLFSAVGSTSTVDARTHLGMDPNVSADADVAVYWLNGAQAAANNSGFWSGTWTNSAQAGRRTAAGSAPSAASLVWTGTKTDGTSAKSPDQYLGSAGNVAVGDNGNSVPIVTAASARTSLLPLYGVSEVFRVGNPHGTALTVSLVDRGGDETAVADEGVVSALSFDFNADADVVPSGGLDLGSVVSAVSLPAGLSFLAASDVPVLAAGDPDSVNVGVEPFDDAVDVPDRTVTYVYRNEPALAVTPADGRVVFTLRDNDPTLVDLTTTAPLRSDLFEGSSVDFAVSLSRVLVDGETIAVPIVVDGGSASDWTIALDAAAANTGVTWDAASGVVEFSGDGAQHAGLVFAAAADGTVEAGAEPILVALGSDTAFDALSATNVGGGADPVLRTDTFTKRFTVDVLDVPSPVGVVRVPFEWDLKPDGVGAGGRFRLLFLTQDTRDATSTDIADYDAFVQASAAGDHTGGAHDAIREHASQFRALGSTGSVFAFEHLRMNPGSPHDPDVAVYWLNGSRVADSSATFWADTWENWGSADRRNAAGTVPTGATGTARPFTGTKHGGRTASPDANRLGSANNPWVGNHRASGTSVDPIGFLAADPAGSRPFYGVSAVFEVAAPAVRIVDVPHDWALNPDGVEPGDEFRLLFVTADGRDATSSDIGVYDAFVRASAAGGHTGGAHAAIVPFARHFKALGSTSEVDAREHLGMNPGVEHHRDVAVYWLGGLRVAAGNAAFWSEGWENTPSRRDAAGAQVPGSRSHSQWVWTGTRSNGARHATNPLGSTRAQAGRHIRLGGAYKAIAHGDYPAADSFSLYGVSPVFRVGAPPDVTVSTCEAGAGCGTATVFVEEGSAAVVRVDVGHELTGSESTEVTATSSDAAGVLLRGPDDLWMGYWPAQPCTIWTYDTWVLDRGVRRLLAVQVSPERVDAEGYATVTVSSADGFKQESRVKLDAHWYEECTGRRGRKVQSQAVQPATPEGNVTYLGRSASIGFGFDAADWAGYTSQVYTTLHKGWREIVVHAPRRCTATGTTTPQSCGGADRVYDVTLTSADTGVALPDIKVVVTPGLGRRDPQISPHCPNEYCLTVAEGATATYTVRNYIVPRPGEPITVTPRVIEGAGVTVAPASVSWTSADDYQELRTFTVTAAHDDDVHARDSRFRIGHDFSDSYVTDGRLEDGEGRDEGWFGLAGTVVDDDKLTLSVTPVGGGDPLDEISLNSGSGGTASFEVRLSGPLVDCAGRDDDHCAESLFIRLQRVVSRTRVPADGVVTMVTRTVNGAVRTTPACDMPPSTLERHRQREAAAGRSTAGLTCTAQVVYDRAPFTASVDGGGRHRELRRTVTADDWDTPIRVDLAMAADFGTSGSYDIVVSLTGYWDNTHAGLTVPVVYGPTLTSTADDEIVDPDPPAGRHTPADPPAEQAVAIGVTQIADTAATIVWASQGNGVQYQIGWYPSPGIPRIKYASTDGTEHRITGLDPETGYKVFVIAYRGAEILDTHTITVTTLADGQTEHVDVTLAPDREQQKQKTAVPTVSVTAGSDVTEGSPAQFTVTASPPPAADLDVTVTVAQNGDWGATAGARTVTIPAAGSVTLTVPTADDDTDEADGSITATLDTPAADAGYTVSATQSAATVAVADDDAPPVVPTVSITAGAAVTEGGDATFTLTASPPPAADLDVTVAVAQNGDWGAAAGVRTVTVGTAGSVTLTVSTADDGVDEADGSVTVTLDTPAADAGYTVSATQSAATVAVADDDAPPVVPTVSVTAGAAVTEGGDATFTVTASPAPAAGLDVTVAVTHSGDYGAAVGVRTVTVGTAGSVTLTVSTADDGVDEADGSVTATVNGGSGYTVSAAQGAATVSVADDDVPEISISAAAGVTEGSPASFAVASDIAPHADIAVAVTVTADGDHGAATGARTVTIAAGATSAALSVATAGDSADEADGSVTATLDAPAAGAGYTVSSTADAATVAVADDDVPEISVTAGAGVTEGSPARFTVASDIAPAADLDVTLTVTAAGDHGAATGARTVTIAAGTTSAALSVATAGDSADEPDGSVTATLDAPAAGAGYTVSSTAGAATVAVADDDEPAPGTKLSVAVADASAAEGATVAVEIRLSHASAHETRIRWNTATAWHLLDDRAHSWDYAAEFGELTFAPGVTAMTAHIWLEDDSIKEPDEHFVIEAYLPRSWFRPDATGTITITDND